MGKIQELVDSMDPEAATGEIAEVIKKLFSVLGEEARLEFIMNVAAEDSRDKLVGLVHL